MSTKSNTLNEIEVLCQKLNYPSEDALKEILHSLKKRRELLAVPHLNWRRDNLNLAKEYVFSLFESHEEAQKHWEIMDELRLQSSNRIENKGQRNIWKINEFSKNREVRCVYCKSEITHSSSEVDHKVPLVRGGKDDKANWQLICTDCNRGKSGLLEFGTYVGWKGITLFRDLIQKGKTEVSRLERFEILSRANFKCKKCLQENHEFNNELGLFFKVSPENGGQAVIDNLVVYCKQHSSNHERVNLYH